MYYCSSLSQPTPSWVHHESIKLTKNLIKTHEKAHSESHKNSQKFTNLKLSQWVSMSFMDSPTSYSLNSLNNSLNSLQTWNCLSLFNYKTLPQACLFCNSSRSLTAQEHDNWLTTANFKLVLKQIENIFIKFNNRFAKHILFKLVVF